MSGGDVRTGDVQTTGVGAGPTVQEWIDARTPPVPAGYVPHITPTHPTQPVSPAALVREARAALDRALDAGAGERHGAFALLAADGFATWACEAALDGSDPGAALDDVLTGLLA